jgi:lysozyme family protein
MQSDFERCLANVIVSEGGYSDDKHDPGGATMNGITQVEYDSWRSGQGLPVQWVEHLSTAERISIYKTEYWDRVHADDLPVGLDYCVFDEGVNSGVARALRALKAMDITQSPEEEIRHFNDIRLLFLKGLSAWKYFGNGWMARVQKVEDIALRMLAEFQESQIKTAQASAQAAIPNVSSMGSAGASLPTSPNTTPGE